MHKLNGLEKTFWLNLKFVLFDTFPVNSLPPVICDVYQKHTFPRAKLLPPHTAYSFYKSVT